MTVSVRPTSIDGTSVMSTPPPAVVDAFSPSYTFRETVVNDAESAFGETIVTDGNKAYVAGNRAPQSTRISTFTDGAANQALVADG